MSLEGLGGSTSCLPSSTSPVAPLRENQSPDLKTCITRFSVSQCIAMKGYSCLSGLLLVNHWFTNGKPMHHEGGPLAWEMEQKRTSAGGNRGRVRGKKEALNHDEHRRNIANMSITFVPILTVLSASSILRVEHPQTHGRPHPRATTAAWLAASSGILSAPEFSRVPSATVQFTAKKRREVQNSQHYALVHKKS